MRTVDAPLPPWFLLGFAKAIGWWAADDIPADELALAESDDWRELRRQRPPPWDRPREPDDE